MCIGYRARAPTPTSPHTHGIRGNTRLYPPCARALAPPTQTLQVHQRRRRRDLCECACIAHASARAHQPPLPARTRPSRKHPNVPPARARAHAPAPPRQRSEPKQRMDTCAAIAIKKRAENGGQNATHFFLCFFTVFFSLFCLRSFFLFSSCSCILFVCLTIYQNPLRDCSITPRSRSDLRPVGARLVLGDPHTADTKSRSSHNRDRRDTACEATPLAERITTARRAPNKKGGILENLGLIRKASCRV